MSDPRSLLERESRRFIQADGAFERLQRRRDHKRRNQRIQAGVLALAIAIAVGWLEVNAIRSTPRVPADESFARANGEVLSFTGVPRETPGDLVAVDPESGHIRVLVEDLEDVLSATWSADGRWVAYVTPTPGSAWGFLELWVVGGSQEPRRIAAGSDPDLFAADSVGWGVWSRTGAELLTARRSSLDDNPQTIERSTLTVTDFATGETMDLGSIEGDAGHAPAWSPDGTRIALASEDGGVFSADLRSGDRTLLARLPSVDRDSVEEIRWSPDGTHIAVVNTRGDGEARLFVMDADGSDVRVLADNYHPIGLAWSLDGTRLAFGQGVQADGAISIWVVSMDGTDPAEIGFVPLDGCTYAYKCGMTWSPDGSAIAFGKDEGEDSVIAADGSDKAKIFRSGEADLIDELTYQSWAGGSYSCEC
jgi:Tol biopolymer transport system component